MMVTTWSMEDVNLLLLKDLPTKDVVFGIGKTKNVLNVLKTGSSITKESVSPSLITARLIILLVIAFLATKDTTW